ncbi:MAG: hypothetical protein HC851_15935 [Acaryochloris sp. RU_4_1]|nr:hypothetical protein [Acaryochloris sp. RU_4_1]NJR55996.1 hypothetical protein [Acaryochloris sp. CRU_2_0]
MAELPQALSCLLTLEENVQIDQTMLPTRDRFSLRLTIYCWRYLQQLSAASNIPLETVQPEQIKAWVHQDQQLQDAQHTDRAFFDWFSHLLASSLQPLTAISQHHQVSIKDLSLDQIINWFQHSCQARLAKNA